MNNNKPLSYDTTLKILKYGTYYNPASDHYGMLGGSSSGQTSGVICDRCYRNNLSICIGYQSKDLCIRCIQEIDTDINRSKNYPPEQNQFKPPLTKMRQFLFPAEKSDEDIKTFMMQDMFNKR